MVTAAVVPNWSPRPRMLSSDLLIGFVRKYFLHNCAALRMSQNTCATSEMPPHPPHISPTLIPHTSPPPPLAPPPGQLRLPPFTACRAVSVAAHTLARWSTQPHPLFATTTSCQCTHRSPPATFPAPLPPLLIPQRQVQCLGHEDSENTRQRQCLSGNAGTPGRDTYCYWK